MDKKIKLEENIEVDNKTQVALMKSSKKAQREKLQDKEEHNANASPLQHPDKLPVILKDLEVPDKVRGPWNRVDKERWLIVTEHLLRCGVKSSREMEKITGISHTSCNSFIKDVKERWQSDLTTEKVNVRREELYGENERIADLCWQIIQMDPLDQKVPSFLKIIGDTNTRRSRLVGAEQITLAVGQIESTNIDTKIIQTQAAAKLGVSVSSLRELGDMMATKMLPALDEESEDEEENKDKE